MHNGKFVNSLFEPKALSLIFSLCKILGYIEGIFIVFKKSFFKKVFEFFKKPSAGLLCPFVAVFLTLGRYNTVQINTFSNLTHPEVSCEVMNAYGLPNYLNGCRQNRKRNAFPAPIPHEFFLLFNPLIRSIL